jgi:hypothetical protein
MRNFKTGSLLGLNFFHVRITHGSHMVRDEMDYDHKISRNGLTHSNIFNILILTKEYAIWLHKSQLPRCQGIYTDTRNIGSIYL